MLIWTLVALVATFLWWVRSRLAWRARHFERLGVPCDPPTPLVGSVGAYMAGRVAFADAIQGIYRRFDGHGLCGYFEFMQPVLMVRDPELIRHIAIKEFDHFTDHRSPIREDGDPIFGRNLVTLQGERWRTMRHTLSPAFTGSKMRTMFDLVVDCGSQLADHLHSECSTSPGGMVELEAKDLFTRFANDVIATSALGVGVDSLRDRDNEFYRAAAELTNFGGRNGLVILGYMISARLMKWLGVTLVSARLAAFYRHLVADTMRERTERGIVRPDMINLLMLARQGKLASDATSEQGDDRSKEQSLSDDDVTAQAVLFLLGGFDTVSTLLCFLCHHLAVHTDVQERLRHEIDTQLAEAEGKLSYEAVGRMRYMDAVISETLRLFPPTVLLDRLCVRDVELPATDNSPAVRLRRGDLVIFPVIGVHRDERHWSEPNEFRPERFVEAAPTPAGATFLPFGLGPRACIGNRFALMEAKVALSSLLLRFELVRCARTQHPVRLERNTFNMANDGGFWLGIKPRSPASVGAGDGHIGT